MGVQLVTTDFTGPLEPGTVGLLLGRSSSALRGLLIHPGVIDSDFTGVVKIMVSSPRGIVAISPGDKIAQLLILPSLHDRFAAKTVERGSRFWLLRHRLDIPISGFRTKTIDGIRS